MRKIQTILIAAAILLMMQSVGCSSSAKNPYLTETEAGFKPGNHEGYLMETTVIKTVRDDIAYSGVGNPWWADRNDFHIAYRPGGDEAVYEEGVIYTVDRIYGHGDHSHNYFNRTRRSYRTSR